jgi:N-acetylneuraminate synthase
MKIANFNIGEKETYVIAEIGINHNGDLEIAKQLIKAAKDCGCNAVKFQKRTIDVVYTPEELATPRENPFGNTNGDLKRGLEFSKEQYAEIDRFCKEIGITWFASPWDEQSVDFLEEFDVPCYKIASASLTDKGLLEKIKATGKPVILSVGMSTEEEIDKAIEILGQEQLVLLYCTCLYPPKYEQINLRSMQTLMKKYSCPVGYSGHEADTLVSAIAVSLGATVIERHFTLDRGMWGSDQKASINPAEMSELIKNIRIAEKIMGTSDITVLDDEFPIKKKLRRVDTI